MNKISANELASPYLVCLCVHLNYKIKQRRRRHVLVILLKRYILIFFICTRFFIFTFSIFLKICFQILFLIKNGFRNLFLRYIQFPKFGPISMFIFMSDLTDLYLSLFK